MVSASETWPLRALSIMFMKVAASVWLKLQGQICTWGYRGGDEEHVSREGEMHANNETCVIYLLYPHMWMQSISYLDLDYKFQGSLA